MPEPGVARSEFDPDRQTPAAAEQGRQSSAACQERPTPPARADFGLDDKRAADEHQHALPKQGEDCGRVAASSIEVHPDRETGLRPRQFRPESRSHSGPDRAEAVPKRRRSARNSWSSRICRLIHQSGGSQNQKRCRQVHGQAKPGVRRLGVSQLMEPAPAEAAADEPRLGQTQAESKSTGRNVPEKYRPASVRGRHTKPLAATVR